MRGLTNLFCCVHRQQIVPQGSNTESVLRVATRDPLALSRSRLISQFPATATRKHRSNVLAHFGLRKPSCVQVAPKLPGYFARMSTVPNPGFTLVSRCRRRVMNRILPLNALISVPSPSVTSTVESRKASPKIARVFGNGRLTLSTKR